MTTKPRRRWLRFSLRTVFVLVTVLACWLGYQLKWIRERRLVLETADLHTYDSDPDYAPWSLRIFGEAGCHYIIIQGDQTEREYIGMRSLFPEADIPPPDEFLPEETPGR